MSVQMSESAGLLFHKKGSGEKQDRTITLSFGFFQFLRNMLPTICRVAKSKNVFVKYQLRGPESCETAGDAGPYYGLGSQMYQKYQGEVEYFVAVFYATGSHTRIRGGFNLRIDEAEALIPILDEFQPHLVARIATAKNTVLSMTSGYPKNCSSADCFITPQLPAKRRRPARKTDQFYSIISAPFKITAFRYALTKKDETSRWYLNETEALKAAEAHYIDPEMVPELENQTIEYGSVTHLAVGVVRAVCHYLYLGFVAKDCTGSCLLETADQCAILCKSCKGAYRDVLDTFFNDVATYVNGNGICKLVRGILAEGGIEADFERVYIVCATLCYLPHNVDFRNLVTDVYDTALDTTLTECIRDYVEMHYSEYKKAQDDATVQTDLVTYY